jgi:hypothetical protein
MAYYIYETKKVFHTKITLLNEADILRHTHGMGKLSQRKDWL